MKIIFPFLEFFSDLSLDEPRTSLHLRPAPRLVNDGIGPLDNIYKNFPESDLITNLCRLLVIFQFALIAYVCFQNKKRTVSSSDTTQWLRHWISSILQLRAAKARKVRLFSNPSSIKQQYKTCVFFWLSFLNVIFSSAVDRLFKLNNDCLVTSGTAWGKKVVMLTQISPIPAGF